MQYFSSTIGYCGVWDSVENKQASLLVVSLGKALNGTPPPLCGPTRTSPDYDCEVANPACQTTLGYPPVAVLLVGGGATSHSKLVRNGLPSSPSLISIRLTA